MWGRVAVKFRPLTFLMTLGFGRPTDFSHDPPHGHQLLTTPFGTVCEKMTRKSFFIT